MPRMKIYRITKLEYEEVEVASLPDPFLKKMFPVLESAQDGFTFMLDKGDLAYANGIYDEKSEKSLPTPMSMWNLESIEKAVEKDGGLGQFICLE
jgi:hypothetical protein